MPARARLVQSGRSYADQMSLLLRKFSGGFSAAAFRKTRVNPLSTAVSRREPWASGFKEIESYAALSAKQTVVSKL
jgi:hypothetical protein